MDYFASPISANIGESPEGFLLCTECIVGRTGFQEYLISELPQDSLRDLGIDTSSQKASIDVYRDPSEVFSPETIASLEGKSLTDGHPPGDQFVDPSNVAQYEFGHIQNVRRGDNVLESGDWPLVADLIIKREPLLSKVREGSVRQLSVGYDYVLDRVGDRLVQTVIRGNHVAVVPRGRAGAEARIIDSAIGAEVEKPESVPPAERKKEIPKVANLLKHLIGLGLKQYAVDADPEKMAEAAEALKSEGKGKDAEEAEAAEKKKKEEKEAEEKKAEDSKRTKDAEEAEKKKAEDAAKKAEDAQHAKDAESDPEGKWKRMHEVLDMCRDKKAMDTDMAELRDLMNEFFEEEEEEPEHAEDGMARVGDSEPRIRLKLRAADNFIAPIPIDEGNSGLQPRGGNGDQRAIDAEFAFLQDWRPIVARSTDKALKAEFNKRLEKFTRGSQPSSGSYGSFARAGRVRAADTNFADRSQESNKKLEEAYKQQRLGNIKKEVA